MNKPKLLDLFCGEGGASRGYQEAGFHVVGVDKKPCKRYCGDEFIQGDVFDVKLEGFDAIHASPPCQQYSSAMRHLARDEPKLIDAIRARITDEESPLAYVIENVPGSEGALMNPTTLCGTMFGLPIKRHRLFETSFDLRPPRPCGDHKGIMNPHRAESRAKIGPGAERKWAEAMGVDWMTKDGWRESIPPAYTKYIGQQMRKELDF